MSNDRIKCAFRFAVMENMRHFLSSYNASTALHLGFKYQNPTTLENFISGGSGYILSKEAIRRFVEIALPQTDPIGPVGDNNLNRSFCLSGQTGTEDVNLCMLTIKTKQI